VWTTTEKLILLLPQPIKIFIQIKHLYFTMKLFIILPIFRLILSVLLLGLPSVQIFSNTGESTKTEKIIGFNAGSVRANDTISGIVNMVSPKYTTNKELMLSLKKYFRSWVLWYIPSWFLKLVLAEASVVYLEGQRVIPGVLIKNNFIFEVDSIDSCIDKIERS